ncbi:AMP-binding enzyme [Helicosporidium sp. ATCC 50920]|nr:AMP-binding enzyme [Helicosporidium sp. ATCC 50920]|eukprot:KDD75281.1 AMP-binding enzyme [Helicosporidium sp. ATCC 50920]
MASWLRMNISLATQVGSDVARGQTILAAGTLLAPAALGLLASCGESRVAVHPAPMVAVLSTGDEVVDAPAGGAEALSAGMVYDANRPALLAAARAAGAQTLDLGIAPDDQSRTLASLEQARDSDADVLLVTGGVSMGDRDYVKIVLQELGTVHFGKVLMKPGKPLTFAQVPRQQGASKEPLLVFGLPGNPVSGLVTFALAVLPCLRKLMGWQNPGLRRVHARLLNSLKMDPERPEYHRAVGAWVPREGGGGEFVAESTGLVTPGLSHVQGPSHPPLLEETLGDLVDRRAAESPTSLAVASLHQGLRWSYAELSAQSSAVARSLLALGVRHGDRVGMWAPNCAEWVAVQVGAAKAGAVLVSLNPAYKARELEYAMRLCGVETLIHAAALRGESMSSVVAAAEEALGRPLRKVVLDASASASPGKDGRGKEAGAGAEPSSTRSTLSWSEFMKVGASASPPPPLPLLSPMDAVNIQYTSGTTGRPKAATLSHRNILNNGFFIGEACRYTSADVICIPVPLFHCFGAVLGNMAALTHGAGIVYPAPSFDPEACLTAVQSERCTALYGVPTMFIAELELPGFERWDLRSLRTGIMAGSPCPVEVMKQVRERMHMRQVTICYGMTETSPVSFQTCPDDPVERQVASVGRIHPHVEARVANPQSGETLPCGEVGELWVRGYSVMRGYWGDERATAEAVDREGWMHTGDLVKVDEQGYCNIVGRIKDMVVRGGENLYPREIEEILHCHPAVAEVQVFGVPDVKYGEELCAWIRLRDGSGDVGEELVRAWCKENMAYFKVPRHFKFVRGFPTTLSGKAQKYLMREMAIKELGLEEAAAITTA